jgi:hypothetical protein
MNTRQKSNRAVALLLGLLAFVSLNGCGGAIDPGAFHRFAESTVELRDGADEVLGIQYDLARDRFLWETAAGDSISEENIQKLLIENVPGKPFAWATPEPQLLFLAARHFRETVGSLNDALVQYADLLVELAGSGRLEEDEFVATATGINTGLQDAANRLSGADHAKEISIFSVGATALFQQYLNSQSKDKLREALNENQGNIQAVADHLRDAMRLTSQHAFAEYSARSFELAMMLTPDSKLKMEKKKDRVVELIELNEVLIKRLDMIRRLDDSYKSLPGANRELAASLDKNDGALGSIYRIRDNAKQLRALQKELLESSSDLDSGSETDVKGE